MLAKPASRNRPILPEAVMSAVEGSERLDATGENGRMVRTPVRVNRAGAIGLGPADSADAPVRIPDDDRASSKVYDARLTADGAQIVALPNP